MLVQGTLQLPGDKSISHRAIMLSAIAEGVSYVRNLNDELICNQQLIFWKIVELQYKKEIMK